MTKLRLSNVAICYRNGIRTKVLKFIAAPLQFMVFRECWNLKLSVNEILATRRNNRNVVEVMNCNSEKNMGR